LIKALDYSLLRKALEAKKAEWGNLRALGKTLGISYSALSHFLSGRPPATVNLFRLCEYASVDPFALCQREAPKKTRKPRKP